MPGLDGIATLDELKRIDEDLAVIIITAYASVESAISAMKSRRIRLHHQAVQERRSAGGRPQRHGAASARSREPQPSAEHTGAVPQVRATSSARARSMRQVFDLIIQAAPSRSTILIQGESGTGKELVARAIHANSSRAERPFVTVNSGNLPAGIARIDAVRSCEGRVHRRRATRKRACSTSRIAAASSSTKSGTSRSRRRRSCCG